MQGYFFLDGFDLYLNFGLIIELGEADVLRYPPRKEPPEHDWLDSHGVQTDLTTPRFNKRDVTLQCAILAPDEATFWTYHDSFIAQFIKPGLHRLEFMSHPGKQYFVYYKSTDSYRQVMPLTGGPFANMVGHKFNLTIVEPDPSKSYGTVITAIADDAGRIIIV